jgi:hypothetical protein
MSWTTAPYESPGVSVRPSEATDFSRGLTCWISSRNNKFGLRRPSHLCVNDRGIYLLVDINFWTHGRSCWAILLRQFVSIAHRHIKKRGSSTWQPIFLSNKLTRDYGRRPAPGEKSTPVAMGNASLCWGDQSPGSVFHGDPFEAESSFGAGKIILKKGNTSRVLSN